MNTCDWATSAGPCVYDAVWDGRCYAHRKVQDKVMDPLGMADVSASAWRDTDRTPTRLRRVRERQVRQVQGPSRAQRRAERERATAGVIRMGEMDG